MEPLPETHQVLNEYLDLGETDLREQLFDLAEKAQLIVPELLAMSLALAAEGLTFTLVSQSVQSSILDAAQYLDGSGPCLAAIETGDVVHERVDDLLDEGQWQLFAQTATAHGIASSLSLPLERDGRVFCGINLYASTADAFKGKHGAVASALHSTAENAVTNADLSFTTLEAAMRAPVRMQELTDIETATGLIAGQRDLALNEARQRIREAAVRSGLGEATVARVVLAMRYF